MNLPFRIVNGVMAALFAFGTAVQYNDPDPVLWMLIYLAASIICLRAALRGNVAVRAAFGIGVIALLWGLVLSGSAPLNAYFHMFDYWEMKSVPMEKARETTGLFFIAAWMGFLSGYALFTARTKHHAF